VKADKKIPNKNLLAKPNNISNSSSNNNPLSKPRANNRKEFHNSALLMAVANNQITEKNITLQPNPIINKYPSEPGSIIPTSTSQMEGGCGGDRYNLFNIYLNKISEIIIKYPDPILLRKLNCEFKIVGLI
jgi:hypothetical protein